MRNLIVHCSNSKSVGTDSYEAFQVPEDYTDEQIDAIAFEMACEQANSYWDVVDGVDYDDEDYDEYISLDEIEAYWEDYDPEKHDGNRGGGGSYAEDFARMEEQEAEYRDGMPF